MGPVPRCFSNSVVCSGGLGDLRQEAAVGTGMQGRGWGSRWMKPLDIVQMLSEAW